MFVHTFYTQGLAINTYLVADARTKQAVIIDPTRDIETYLEFIKKEQLTLTDILETHVHADFVSGAPELKQACRGYPSIHCSVMGGNEWLPKYADRAVKEGDSVDYPGVRLTALHTPGHTPEHITWLGFDKAYSDETPSIAFTGDFLFVGSVGRPDLLGKLEAEKLSRQLYDSLFNRIAKLPDTLEIYPAHGAGSLCGKALSSKTTSSLGVERQKNPMIHPRPYEEWSALLIADMPRAPLNYGRIKKINLQGPASIAKQTKNSVYMDVRIPDKFAHSHLLNAINIPLGPSFCNWVGSVFYEDASLGVIADSPEQLSKALKNLKLIGFDQVSSWIWDWEELSKTFALDTGEVIGVNDLFAQMRSSEIPLCIIDVRTPAEWNSGHIKGALHIELSELAHHVHTLPENIRIYAICGSGYRASIAASFLAEKGYPTVNVAGGMDAWKLAGLPIICS